MDKKYIDADTLWNRLISVSENDWVGFDTIDEILSEMPAADVEEVVRCKDCKHYNAGFECLIEGYGIERDKEWYCGYAKRRTDE